MKKGTFVSFYGEPHRSVWYKKRDETPYVKIEKKKQSHLVLHDMLESKHPPLYEYKSHGPSGKSWTISYLSGEKVATFNYTALNKKKLKLYDPVEKDKTKQKINISTKGDVIKFIVKSSGEVIATVIEEELTSIMHVKKEERHNTPLFIIAYRLYQRIQTDYQSVRG